MKLISLFIPFLILISTNLQAAQANHFKKVVTVFFENMDYSAAMKSPVLQNLANRGVLFDNLFASLHPSQGNYIAYIAGNDFKITSDSNVDLNEAHVGDQLETHGLNWKVYASGYPGHCFTGAQAGLYVRKHNPFMSFLNVTRNSTRCENIVNADQFIGDFNSGRLPEYSLWVPDLVEDGHDSGIQGIENWVNNTLMKLVNQPLKDTLVILTFDESGYFSNNRVYTIALGDAVVAKSVNHQKLTHKDLLGLVQSEYDLGILPKQSPIVPIQGIWK